MFVGHRLHSSWRSYKIMISRICYNIVLIIHFLSFQQLNQSGRGVNTVDGNINHAYTPHITDGDLPPSYTEVITSQSRPWDHAWLLSITYEAGCAYVPKTLNFPIGHVNEYPTMHYFGIPRHMHPNIAYENLTECFWKFQGKLQCGNVVIVHRELIKGWKTVNLLIKYWV